MSDNNNCTISCGGIFTTLLAIVFIVLKLIGYIDCSCRWVLTPIWITVLISIGAVIVFIGTTVILDYLND